VIEVVGWSWNGAGAVMRVTMERGGGGDGVLFYKRTAAHRGAETGGAVASGLAWAPAVSGRCGKADSAPRDEVDFSPCLVRRFSPNFTMQKEDFLSHQNVGKCMEY
jgi:hypothetical protein